MFQPIDTPIDEIFHRTDAELRRQPALPLATVNDTGHDTIYMLFYTGDHPHYQSIRASVEDNQFDTPIFIGKVYKPSDFDREGDETTLAECKRSISMAINLNIEDFYVRYREVVLLSLLEYVLIERYQPIWNCEITGL